MVISGQVRRLASSCKGHYPACRHRNHMSEDSKPPFNPDDYEVVFPRIKGQTFKNVSVVIDFHVFEECTFEDCVLIYNGYGPNGMFNCNISGCRVAFAGPADHALDFLSLMHRIPGFAGVAKEFMESIRKGEMKKATLAGTITR